MQRARGVLWYGGLMGGLLSVFFCGSIAFAQTCIFGAANCINIHIDGITGFDGNGNYDLTTYDWGQPGVAEPLGASPVLTFSREIGDSTTTEMMQAALKHQKAATADLSVIYNDTVTISYHMTNVHFVSVMQHGDKSLITTFEATPLESVTIHFQTLEYTYQPILPNGQKNGPPVTFTWKFLPPPA